MGCRASTPLNSASLFWFWNRLLISKKGALMFDYSRNHHLIGSATVCDQSGGITVHTADVIDLATGGPYPSKTFSLKVINANTVSIYGQNLTAGN